MTGSGEVTQETLDSAQYATASILAYETVYGEDFVSPGGYELANELIGAMQLAPGSRVLDVGCGLGGSAFVMARDFEFIVDGIDLSLNMLKMANEKLRKYGLTERITLKHGDCLEMQCPDCFDAIYSRDVFLHIHDKPRLFSVLKSLLRPGGKLLFTDYCCGEKPWKHEFSEYVEDRGYDLHTLFEYAALVSEAGFSQVVYSDLSSRFIEILETDLVKIENLDVDESIKAELALSWRGKLERSKSGDHKWGLITAVKPD
jgi:phosphoethanolamine N-methyltransferase